MKKLRKLFVFMFAIILMPIMMLMVIFGGTGSNSHDDINSPASLSPYVESYRSYVTEVAENEDIKEYVALILAVMQVESNGQGTDPMQSSEGAFNKLYPNTPNGIKDPYYSITCGIKELKDCLKKASVSSAKDTEKIKVALAGYNFGPGFITWIERHGGKWSLELAQEYSDKMAKELGWSVYGDPPYVTKVLNYYMSNNTDYIIGDGDFVLPMKGATITSGFGHRDLNYDFADYHYGIDFDGGYGSNIYAPINARVYAISDQCDPDGGYLGNMCPMDNHANGGGNYVQLEVKYKGKLLYITMCHMSKIYVQKGQEVKQGEAVGAQGHSGNSTAAHLHFEIHEGTPNALGTMEGVIDPMGLMLGK